MWSAATSRKSPPGSRPLNPRLRSDLPLVDWLGEEPATEVELKALLACSPARIKIWAVDRRVGNVLNDGRELVEPMFGEAC
jgi:hypothetical protein